MKQMLRIALAIIAFVSLFATTACSNVSYAVAVAMAEKEAGGKVLWSSMTDTGYNFAVCRGSEIVMIGVHGASSDPQVVTDRTATGAVCGPKAEFWELYAASRHRYNVEEQMRTLSTSLDYKLPDR